jgi:hypothetical protein
MRSLADVFPAVAWIAPPNTVAVSDLATSGPSPEGTRKIDRVRVVLLGNNILIAQDSPEGPKLVFREGFTSRLVNGKTNTIKTDTGKVIAFTKDDNCGCGSRLRTWNPYGQNSSVYSTSDPVE